MECSKKIDTISISPKPRIKCYAVNHKTCNLWFDDDVGKKPIEKITNLTQEKWLWTGESTYCTCNHHVEQHCTVRDRMNSVTNIHCHGSKGRCNCELFIPCSIRLSCSNCYQMVTEGLTGDFEIPEIYRTQTMR